MSDYDLNNRIAEGSLAGCKWSLEALKLLRLARHLPTMTETCYERKTGSFSFSFR